MSVSSKYTSACSQFSVSAQPWTGRNSVRKPEKNEMENEVPEDELVGKRDLDFRTANWALATEIEEILHSMQRPARTLVAWSCGALKISSSLFFASHNWDFDSTRACLGKLT